jgi:hypothetical protein
MRIVRGRKHDDGQATEGRLRSQPFQNLETGDLGHLEVEQRERRQRVFDPIREMSGTGQVIDRLLAIAGHKEGILDFGSLEGPLQEENIVLIILRQEDPQRLIHACLAGIVLLFHV